MIKDYWIFQESANEKQWALYVVKEYDKRVGREAVVIDYTLYHEDIPNAAHADSVIGLHFNTIADYVNTVLAHIREYSVFTDADAKQLTREFSKILS